MQVSQIDQLSSNYFKAQKLRQHNTHRILQQSQKMFYTKFQSSVIQRKSEQIIFEVKQNLLLIQNLHKNLSDDLNNLGLEYISAGFISLQNYVNYLISFLCKTANRLSQSCEIALKSKLESKITDKNLCEICFKKIEQIRIKNIETKISENTNKFQKLLLNQDEIKQIYQSEEILQHELADNKLLTQGVLSEFFLKKQLLQSLNNDKTITILEQFLKSLSVQGDKKHSIPNIIQKSYIIDYKNGKEIVNKLYNDFLSHIIQMTKKDMIPIFQRATLDYTQKQKEFYRSKLKNRQTQTYIDVKNGIGMGGEIFGLNDHDKKGKYIDNLINQNWQYKKQIQRLSKQKKKAQKNSPNKHEKRSIDSLNSQLQRQIKREKSKFLNLSSKQHQKQLETDIKIINEYENKIEKLEKQIISNYKEKSNVSVQVEIKGIDKASQTYYIKISDTQKYIEQQQLNKQPIKQSIKKDKKNGETLIDIKQIQKKDQKIEEETKIEGKTVTKKFHDNKKNSKNRSSIVNNLNSMLSSKLLKSSQNKQNKVNKESLIELEGKIKHENTLNNIAVQTQPTKILQLDQLHLQTYQNYRTEINTMTNNIKKQLQKKQILYPINLIKENQQNNLGQKNEYLEDQSQKLISNQMKQMKQIATNKKILQLIKNEQGNQQKNEQQYELKEFLKYLLQHEINFKKDIELLELLKTTIKEKKSKSKSKVKQFHFPLNFQTKKQTIHLSENKIKKYKKRKFYLKTCTQQDNIHINRQLLNYSQNKDTDQNRQASQNFVLNNNRIKEMSIDKFRLNNYQNNSCQKQQCMLHQKSSPKIEFDADDLMLFGGLTQSYKFEINNKKNSIKKKKSNKQTKYDNLTNLQSYLIEQLYNHIENMKNNQREKYNNIKAFFKFPYQTAINKFNILDLNQSLCQNIFRNTFNYIFTMHKKCEGGQICQHIMKFINKIGVNLNEIQIKKSQIIFPKLC